MENEERKPKVFDATKIGETKVRKTNKISNRNEESFLNMIQAKLITIETYNGINANAIDAYNGVLMLLQERIGEIIRREYTINKANRLLGEKK